MGRPHPMALRERVVAFVEEGHSHRAAAARFRVSVRFVNELIKLRRETGSLKPRPQGEAIGFEVGYEDPNFFRRLFKRTTGITPARYRQRFSRIAMTEAER